MSFLSALTGFGTSSATDLEAKSSGSWFSSMFPVAYNEDEEESGDDAEEKGDDSTDGDDSKNSDGAEDGDDAKEDNGGDGDDDESGDDEEEEDEDEDDEPEDPMPEIYDACKESAACKGLHHHFEECQQRVTSGKGFPNEDCTEEFFHLAECALDCTAPKLFSKLV